MGVGYIIGPRIAGYLFAGGCLAYLVLMPAIKLFGAARTTPMYPATKLIAEMSAGEVRAAFVFYIGAGAVATAGIIALVRSLPTIASAFKAGFADLKASRVGQAVVAKLRTDDDLPITVTVFGSLLLALVLAFLPSIGVNLLGGLLIIVFGFFFTTVSSRICGQIGSSANPISGMTIASLIAISLIFLLLGWTQIDDRVRAISIACVIAVAVANGGNTSQDLKTGFLVGATPRRQQIAILVGAIAAAMAVGWTLTFLNSSYRYEVPETHAGFLAPATGNSADGNVVVMPETMSRFTVGGSDSVDTRSYQVVRVYVETQGVPPGKYLVDPASHEIRYLVDPGIGGRVCEYHGRELKRLDSPKATLMALITDGILTHRLPWALVLIGVFLSIALELAGIQALPVAVGVYLPITTSAGVFAGGVVRWLGGARVEAGKRSLPRIEAGPGGLAATEMVAALGALPRLVGVSHECDYPPEARALPRVTRTRLDPSLPSAEIDRAMAAARRTGTPPVEVDVKLIAHLRPDVILGQSLCDVCAVGESGLAQLVAALMPTPWVVTLHAHTLDGVLGDIRKVGAALNLEDEADELVAGLRYRLRRIRQAHAPGPTPPSVLVLEWLDPPYVAGHWVPELVEIAGGRGAAGRPGGDSTARSRRGPSPPAPDPLVVPPGGV